MHPVCARLTVLLSAKQCDVDSVMDTLPQPGDPHSADSPVAFLRLPPLLSLSSPLSAGVVDSPAVKRSVIVCVLSLLRTLLRVDNCIQISSRKSQAGRMVGGRTARARSGKGWVGKQQGHQAYESSDDSDTELDIQ